MVMPRKPSVGVGGRCYSEQRDNVPPLWEATRVFETLEHVTVPKPLPAKDVRLASTCWSRPCCARPPPGEGQSLQLSLEDRLRRRRRCLLYTSDAADDM
eukprot:3388795-Rhodomonas_salina.1